MEKKEITHKKYLRIVQYPQQSVFQGRYLQNEVIKDQVTKQFNGIISLVFHSLKMTHEDNFSVLHDSQICI